MPRAGERRIVARGPGRLQRRAEAIDDLEVGALVVPADVVFRLPAGPRSSAEEDAGAVVVDVEPVAHVAAVAVDRQRLALDGVQDHQRDQLLGELVRAVVVRAVGDAASAARTSRDRRAPGGRRRPWTPRRASWAHRPCPPRSSPSARASRTPRPSRRGGSGSAARVAASRSASVARARPRAARTCPRRWSSTKARGPSIERSTWVSAAKFTMAVGRCARERRGDGGAVGDVGLDEREARVAGHVAQALEAARVGQLVEDDDARRGARQGEPDEVRPDEAGPAGDEQRSHARYHTTAPYRANLRRRRALGSVAPHGSRSRGSATGGWATELYARRADPEVRSERSGRSAMADIVLGIGSSHSPMLSTPCDAFAGHADRDRARVPSSRRWRGTRPRGSAASSPRRHPAAPRGDAGRRSGGSATSSPTRRSTC